LALVFGGRISNIGPSPSRRTLTDTSRFCPKMFVKDFFVPKKQKHEMRLTNGLAKNRRTEVLSAFVSLFCFGPG